jgi:sulfatase maturation enzyme AslB (radical SAM superfamily)
LLFNFRGPLSLMGQSTDHRLTERRSGGVEATSLPWIPIPHLDDLWFQVGGTLCNLTCHHCFISCSPKNRSFGFLSLEEVKRRLEESVALGVKEYYFTGGEPFLNPEMTEILCETLRYGPATVLTNATVLKAEWLERLRSAEEASLYSLEFRVSIDGFSPETNDPIRGIGTFERAMEGVEKLVTHGFLPIITAARTWPMEQDREVVEQFVQLLKARGYDRPRLKILPTLHIGAEEQRTHGYGDDERVTPAMLDGYDQSQLVCQHSRIVTDRGIQVCPILIELPDSVLGQTLAESLRPYAIQHGACWTCYQFGAICSNPSSGNRQGVAR